MPRITSVNIKLHHREENCCFRNIVLDESRSEPRLQDFRHDGSVSEFNCEAEFESDFDAAIPGGVEFQFVDGGMTTGGYYRIYPRGRGASDGPPPYGHAVVSRWAAAEEAAVWLRNAGTAIPSEMGGDRLYVALPGALQPNGAGPVRIDFAVPKSALIQTGHAEWRVIWQPVQSTPIHNVIITVPIGVTLPDAK